MKGFINKISDSFGFILAGKLQYKWDFWNARCLSFILKHNAHWKRLSKQACMEWSICSFELIWPNTNITAIILNLSP